MIFMSFEICNFLLVINSNLGPIFHRLATIHPLQTKTTTDDNRAKDAYTQHSYSASKNVGKTK